MEFYRKILDWINEIKTDTKAHLQKQESLPELYCAKEECGKLIKGSQAFYQENSGSVYHLACGSVIIPNSLTVIKQDSSWKKGK